jgi:DNA-binding NarL/FixJ family response regulator
MEDRKVVIRVLDALARDTLVHWLGTVPGYVVAGSVSSGPALARLCALRRPDVVVAQFSSTDPDELALVAGLRGVRPVPYIVGVHGVIDSGHLLRLQRAGVHRLVGSRFGVAGLRAALDEAADGPPHELTGSGLSRRELEILALVRAGCSADDIAEELQISRHTVTNHTRRVFLKLGVHSRTQAAAEASRLGLGGDVVAPSQHDVVAGQAGAVRDEVSRILAASRPDSPVTVLVHPTEACWRASSEQADKIVVVDADHPEPITDAVLRGARAVLPADDVRRHLPAVIALVRAGYLVAADGVVRRLLRGGRRLPGLTPRERDILESIALGHSVRETAKALGIAVKTVQSEQRQLFAKLGARNRPAALANAKELGLIES